MRARMALRPVPIFVKALNVGERLGDGLVSSYGRLNRIPNAAGFEMVISELAAFIAPATIEARDLLQKEVDGLGVLPQRR